MPPAFALHLVTLGVADLPRATAFYAAMGLERREHATTGVSFFQAGGVALSLFPRAALATDAGLDAEAGTGRAAATLAFNVPDEASVDAALAHAARLGAEIVKPAQRAFWGGYSGYFADPDGHLWEVAHNPFWPLDADGRPTLPD